MKPKVAIISTGGTLAAIGKNSLDIQDYPANDVFLNAREIVARFPEVFTVADVIPVDFMNVGSTKINFPEWKSLVLTCDRLIAEYPNLSGIVIGHGTATMEETAYLLNLTAGIEVPIVLVGAQRPISALSSDSGMNLLNAVRVAAAPESRGRGALLILNDEIHAAREVTKTSTYRTHAFRSPDFGILGQADGDAVIYYRSTERRHMPRTEFDIRNLECLPRVDIVYSYTGADGTAIESFVAAGAKGIVSAGFAPGYATPSEQVALRAAAARGLVIVQSSRAGSGRVFRATQHRNHGILSADNLSPQKARILLALALTVTHDLSEIERIFATY